MNLYSNQTLTQIRQSFNPNSMFWMFAPVEKPFHYEDLIGDVEVAYASNEPIHLPATLDLPDIEPDEFENDYCWFLS